MLDALLRALGVDLQTRIAQVQAHIKAFKDETKQEVWREVKEAAVTASLAFAAFGALAASCVVALWALYMWVGMQKGPFVAFAVVGSLTTLSSAVLFAWAMSRANRKTTLRLAATVPPRPAMATPQAAQNVAPPQPLPANASLFDVVAHRVTTRASSEADKAIDVASDLVENGSRSTLIRTLVLTALIGFLIGRQRNV